MTSFAYNNRRQLTNTVAPTNLLTSVAYDANANVLTTSDRRGFVISNNWSVTRQLLTTTLPATAQGVPIIKNFYDSRDWLASAQNPLGKTTYYTNDSAHRLITSTDPLNRTTTFGYDGDSRPTTNTDAALAQTIQTFDSRGDLVRVLDAATSIVGRAYDGAANLICLTNRNTNVWRFQYDGANRVTNTISPLGRSFSQIYNNRGLLQSSTDPLLQTTSLGYDARGRMMSKTDNMGIINYQYDGNNNLTLLTNVGTGTKLSWAFDAYNRATSFTSAAGYVIQYRYDANGNVTNLIYPGNRTVQYSYDSNNHLTNVMDWAGRQTVYTYDLVGRLTGIVRPNNTLRSMGYDDAGQLTNIVEKATSQFPITFYTLHYDLAGKSDWEFKGPLPRAFSPPSRNMTYDADDRLATFNGTSVTVDADGNLTYGPLTNSAFGAYTYDTRNELTSAGGMGYGYDLSGNRTSITNSSVVTILILNPQSSQVLMRIRNGTTNYYIYGKGLVYEIDETATTTNTVFYHFDNRGSTVALTDKSGNLTDQIEYSPYGTITYRTGTNDTPFLFNGRYGVQTDGNGLLYMWARYYNPYISRFINSDPTRFAGGLDFFTFANGNPISLVDPTGLGAVANGNQANLDDPFGLFSGQSTTGGGIGAAGVLEQAGQVRYNYNSWVAQYVTDSGGYSPTRDAIRDYWNLPENSTALSRSIGPLYRLEQSWSGVDPSLANPTVTSAAVNNAAAIARYGGQGLIVVGTGLAVYDISTSPDPYRATVQNGSAIVVGSGGATVGAWAGAGIGAAIGSVVPVAGTAIGGAVGAVVGAIAGGIGGGMAGHALGTAAYDSNYGPNSPWYP